MIGIIQGRLSPPIEGFQETPKNWKKEFDLIQDIGLNHIDWVVTSLDNPIFYEDLKQYPINSICADNLITKDIFDVNFLTHAIGSVCGAARQNRILSITIPLLEESSMVNDEDRHTFIKQILPIVDNNPDINFSFEAELEPSKLLEIVELRDNMFVTYDTGNTTSFGLDHKDYIVSVKHKIDNVHIKDRTFQSETVRPFTGDTDFELIFNVLSSINYNQKYTLQAARQD